MAFYIASAGFGATDTNLYTVDVTTGDLTLVGDTGQMFTGLAFDPTDGTLYGSTANTSANPRRLYTIDPATGAATLIAALGGAAGAAINDLSFDSSGNLFGWHNSTKKLTQIDKATAGLTDIGSAAVSSGSGNGLALDPSGTFFWFFHDGTHGDMWNIDKASGAVTDVGLLWPYVPTSYTVGAASMGPGGVLYGLGTDSPSEIFTCATTPDVDGQYACASVCTVAGGPWDALAWDGEGGGSAEGTFTKIKFGTGLVVTDEGDGVIRVDVVLDD